MRNALIAVLAAAAVTVGGCAHKRATAGDEFAVARTAPLIIPPDFSLAPPVAGTQGRGATDAQQQAVDALFGGPAARSAGETSLLDEAGRGDAQFAIRSTVWDPDTRIVDKGATTLQILSAPAANTTAATAQAGR